MILPDAKTKEAAKAARKISFEGNLFGSQIIDARITDMNVIRKLTGRIIFIKALNISVNSIKMLMRVLPKLTKRKRNVSINQL